MQKSQTTLVSGKKYIWNLSTCICEKRKYLESIICDSVIMCDKIIYTKSTIPTKTIWTKAALINFLLTFLIITLALLIDVNIYCYLIKYQSKSYHITNNKLQETDIKNIT